MSADEFAEIVRKGEGRLRVDRVVVRAGEFRFSGSGSLEIIGEEFRLDVALSKSSSAPAFGAKLWNEDDFWSLRGLVEHSLPVSATHVSPCKHSSSEKLIVVTLAFGSLRVMSSRISAKKRREMLRLLEEIRQKHPASHPQTEGRKPERKRTVARFEALIPDFKLPAHNAGTTTVRKNPFFKYNAQSSEADTLILRGRTYDVALIQRRDDVEIHLRSKGRYKSKSAAEDSNLFQGVLDAVGFCYGFNPWPHRRQQWRDERSVLDLLSVPRRLPQTVHAPFDEALGQASPPPILLVARFFHQRSQLSRKISEFLFLFRQAGDEPVHLPVQTLAFCSLFEGLVNLLFEELQLERRIHRSDPSFAAFMAERDRLVVELRAQGKAGDSASNRLAGLLSQASAIRVADKFKALCRALDLNYTEMKPHFDAWYEERNPLMHGTWRTERDSVFENQARIAGAINILLLKVMGYRGRVVAMRFGGETYRVI